MTATETETETEPDHPGDRGVATLWAAGAIAAVMVVTVVVVWIGAAANARHRAAAAADLAALAAAGSAIHGERSACDKASWVADRMRVTLASCRLDGWNALVEITAAPPGVLAGFGPAEARARAGPGKPVVEPRRTVVPER
ncbi:Rv3654c family TadE-like protein [Actinophytocola gossypii]|uniref:Rv3654c family TadE-like protein n=1 Tax=Actinophytocola gossypii TaxID=2812003 RepID=UPI0021A40E32|nr:Rv3654c family TadE-like protein [Actinophytocola gossypii]